MTGPGMIGVYDPDELERNWKAAADALEGTYDRSAVRGLPVVQVRRGDAWVTLELVATDTGFRTRVRAPFHHGGDLSLVVTDEGGLQGILKRLGFLQDIELGRADFDDRFLARGFPVATIRRLLAPPVVDLIVEQAFLDLRIAQWVGDARYPRGVAELRLQRSRIVRETQSLVGMVRIALVLVPRLDPLGHLAEAELDDLVSRLSRPGGQVADSWRGVTLWDGDPPRREAARRLGRHGDLGAVPALLSVLDDPDDGVAVEAIRALAALGDPRAIGPLVAWLGRRRGSVDGHSLAGHAGEALRSFGADELVTALDRALEGDPQVLADTAGGHRAEVGKALMEVLDSFDLEARVHAATALGVLGVREALPLLREKTRAMGLRTKLTEASRAAMEAIEARASLPRPARPLPEGPDTLPRPAAPAGDSTGPTLPRPGSAPESPGPPDR